MSRLLAVLSVLLAVAAPTVGLAQSYDDPRALLEALYAGYMPPNEFPPDQSSLQSERLRGVFEKDQQDANGEIGRIDFDPFVNGQDYQITDLAIGEPYLAAGKAVVAVTFANMGTPQELGYLLVKEDGWKVDDVWYTGDDFSYDLLDILQQPLP
jgi:hypothetical protein